MSKKIEQIDKHFVNMVILRDKIHEIVDRVNEHEFEKETGDKAHFMAGQKYGKTVPQADAFAYILERLEAMERKDIKESTWMASMCDCGRRKGCEQITTCASPRRVYFYLKSKDQDATGRPEFINIIHCPFCGGKLPG